MDLGIKGKKAIVCASSRGLGKATAMALAEDGADLVINGLDPDRLEKTAEEIRAATGVTVTPVAADMGTPEGRAAVLAACPEPDILVNNNGGPPLKDFRELDHDAIIAGVEMNMVSPIAMIQAVIDGMCERKFGRIVNITSGSVKSPIYGLDLSSAARGGLTAFVAGVARSVAMHNVTINGVLPGPFDTDRLRGGNNKVAEMQGKSVEEVIATRVATIPARRFGQPEEFGHAAAFLCSAQAGFITGQNLLLDGGQFNSAI